MTKPRCLLVTGPPCSGKSTLADLIGENEGWRSFDVEERVDRVQDRFGTGRVSPELFNAARLAFIFFARQVGLTRTKIDGTIRFAEEPGVSQAHVSCRYVVGSSLAMKSVMNDVIESVRGGCSVAVSGYEFYQSRMSRLGARTLLQREGMHPELVVISAEVEFLMARALERTRPGYRPRTQQDLRVPASLPTLMALAEDILPEEDWKGMINLHARDLVDVPSERALEMVSR